MKTTVDWPAGMPPFELMSRLTAGAPTIAKSRLGAAYRETLPPGHVDAEAALRSAAGDVCHALSFETRAPVFGQRRRPSNPFAYRDALRAQIARGLTAKSWIGTALHTPLQPSELLPPDLWPFVEQDWIDGGRLITPSRCIRLAEIRLWHVASLPDRIRLSLDNEIEAARSVFCRLLDFRADPESSPTVSPQGDDLISDTLEPIDGMLMVRAYMRLHASGDIQATMADKAVHAKILEQTEVATRVEEGARGFGLANLRRLFREHHLHGR